MVSHYSVVYVNRLPTVGVIVLTGREIETLKEAREVTISLHLLWMMIYIYTYNIKYVIYVYIYIYIYTHVRIYVGDAFNHMILDTGCRHNIAGEIWVNCFFEGLSDKELKLAEKSPSTTKFKSGGGRVLQSLYKIQAPILATGCHVIISFNVVESDIPLLLGKKTMKNWYLVINASDTLQNLL